MSISEKLFGEDVRNADWAATAKVNAIRIGIATIIWTIVSAVSGGDAMPILAMPVALVAGLCAHVLHKIGIPLAGLFAFAFSCFLVVADPFLRILLSIFGTSIGLDVKFGFLNFVLLLIVQRPTPEEIAAYQAQLNNEE